MILFRLVFQTVFLALGQIWSNKVRALLTTLGIVIGVSAVIGTVAATQGLKTYVLDQFESIGANRVWIFPRMPREQPGRFSWRQIRMNNKEILGMARAAPSIKRMTPNSMFTASVANGDRIEPTVQITGIWPEWHDIEGRTVVQGRPFFRIDEDERRQVCLINDKAIDELSLDTNCVGQSLLIDGRKFLIVGVVETKTPSPMFGGGEARTEVYIPWGTGDMMKPEPFSRQYVSAQTHTPDQFEDVKAEITSYLRKTRNLIPGDPDTFGIEAIEQAKEQFNKVAVGITVAASGIVAISLVVGGVGIMNIMLVSVSERTREIGLRKAMGARPGVILIQFLIEAIVLCLVGAAVGLAIGYGGVMALAGSGGKEGLMAKASVPLWAVWLSAGFSAATGIVFGMFPAIKAARLDPIDALRHE